MSSARLQALRAVMAAQPRPLAAYIVPTADAHNSEYICPTDARREWLSRFTGSAGVAVLTSSRALMWTDGRYYTQFEKEADMDAWTLMKQSLPETPTMEKWLTTNLTEGSIVGADPTTMRREEWTPLQTALSKANMELLAVKDNLVDLARQQLEDAPPPRPANPLIVLPVKYTGKKSGQKIAELREKMQEKKAAALIITALDEVAYTLNLRGSDIEYNPVFFSYLLIRPDNVVLFWHQGTLEAAVEAHLRDEGVEGVEVKRYGEVFGYLEGLAKELSETGDGKHSIWLSHDASEAIHTAAAGVATLKKPLNLISEISPVALAKQIKNEVELQGFRACHVRDGVAVIRFFRWLHEEVGRGRAVTEIQAADKLLEFRKDEADFMGPSFETIAGAGANGAIIHYGPSRDGPQTEIKPEDMFLLDSGGQYRDGTTDITRTRHMSSCSAEQRETFTRVLKGQITLGAALFPRGVKGNVLDTLARHALWRRGLDYAHGTGHGVGHFLNVHEGPNRINAAPRDDPGVQPGMVYSNEPGYYEVGEYGIRHEDLMVSIEMNKDAEHIYADQMRGDFAGRGAVAFHAISLAPHQTSSLDVSLLTDEEIKYLNDYHARVLSTLGPILQSRNLSEDYQWLVEECAPITNAAILMTATPLLLLAALCLWF